MAGGNIYAFTDVSAKEISLITPPTIHLPASLSIRPLETSIRHQRTPPLP
jgi:hypothetical protein